MIETTDVLQPKNMTAADIEIPAFLGDELFNEDLDAAEIGSYAPRILPGKVWFRFEPTVAIDRTTKLPTETGLSSVNVQGQVYPQIEYTGHVQTDSCQLVTPTNEAEIKVTFQRASTYVFPKRGISTAGELYRSLGLDKKYGKPRSTKVLLTRLRDAGGEMGIAKVEWEAYNKDTRERFSTRPNIKKGDKSWPRDDKGNLSLHVTFSDGQVAYGRERFSSLHVKM